MNILRQAKIDDSQLLELVYHAVLWLQVSVHDIVDMNVMKTGHYHVHDAADLFFREQSLEFLTAVLTDLFNLLIDHLLQVH